MTNKLNAKESYNRKGLYNGYDKNNKEREALDYYSTPTEEVTNILKTLNIDFSGDTILEPSAGGGHMSAAILDYLNSRAWSEIPLLISTDIQKRELCRDDLVIAAGKEYDFLSDNYPHVNNIDWIVMNPPYSLIEPFVMRSLGIANKGVIMLGRLQFLEGQSRYDNILKDFPPDEVYVYVDRIGCYKNGDVNQNVAKAQAYAWFVWRTKAPHLDGPRIRWIRRADKIKGLK